MRGVCEYPALLVSIYAVKPLKHTPQSTSQSPTCYSLGMFTTRMNSRKHNYLQSVQLHVLVPVVLAAVFRATATDDCKKKRQPRKHLLDYVFW